eukprot:SAG11_NODE_1696_length_4435_cov_3.645295_3_plen_96_part_00
MLAAETGERLSSFRGALEHVRWTKVQSKLLAQLEHDMGALKAAGSDRLLYSSEHACTRSLILNAVAATHSLIYDPRANCDQFAPRSIQNIILAFR